MRRASASLRIAASAVLAFVVSGCIASATIPANEYGLEVVTTAEQYRRSVAADPAKELVDLAEFTPGVRLDVRYATADNFLNKQLYPYAAAYLRRPAAEALRAANAELAESGLALKVWDAYRPYAVTKAMWEPIRNPDYVADPAKGSRHNRGAAVDVTLVDVVTGRELPMPTAHDDFTTRASWEFSSLPPDVLQNRERLRAVMERHGFEPLPSEWWHFDFRGWEKFELMDVPFDALP